MTQNILDDPILNPGPKIVTYAVDADPLMGVRRVNTDGTPSATGSIAMAAGIITFYSTNTTGTAEGGVGAINFPDETGLADGVLDLSAFGSAAATWLEVVNLINNQPNWEAWLIGARPEVVIADTDLLAEAVAVTTAGIVSNAGHFVKGDTSVMLAIAVGITNNNSSQIGASKHNNDHGYNHKLVDMIGTGTYSSGSLAFNVYDVDDDAGTSTLIFSRAGGATTVEAAHSQDMVIEGNRLVVELAASAVLTAGELILITETVRVGIGQGGFFMSDNG